MSSYEQHTSLNKIIASSRLVSEVFWQLNFHMVDFTFWLVISALLLVTCIFELVVNVLVYYELFYIVYHCYGTSSISWRVLDLWVFVVKIGGYLVIPAVTTFSEQLLKCSSIRTTGMMRDHMWEVCRDRSREQLDFATYMAGGLNAIDSGMETDLYTYTHTVTEFLHYVGKKKQKSEPYFNWDSFEKAVTSFCEPLVHDIFTSARLNHVVEKVTQLDDHITFDAEGNSVIHPTSFIRKRVNLSRPPRKVTESDDFYSSVGSILRLKLKNEQGKKPVHYTDKRAYEKMVKLVQRLIGEHPKSHQIRNIVQPGPFVTMEEIISNISARQQSFFITLHERFALYVTSIGLVECLLMFLFTKYLPAVRASEVGDLICEQVPYVLLVILVPAVFIYLYRVAKESEFLLGVATVLNVAILGSLFRRGSVEIEPNVVYFGHWINPVLIGVNGMAFLCTRRETRCDTTFTLLFIYCSICLVKAVEMRVRYDFDYRSSLDAHTALDAYVKHFSSKI